jgi:uncharacterized phiE125 gp8 family phage protein
MSLAANALATFASAKAMFGYQDDEQTKVEDLINIASSRMEAYCRRKLAARDFSLLLDGTGRGNLILPEYPVNSVERLAVDSSRAFGADSDIASTDYSVLSEEGIIRLYSGTFYLADVADVVLVEFNAGYAVTHPLCAVLRAACLEYVDWLKSRFATPGSIGKKGEYSADRVSVSYETEMPLHVRAALAPFERAVA